MNGADSRQMAVNLCELYVSDDTLKQFRTALKDADDDNWNELRIASQENLTLGKIVASWIILPDRTINCIASVNIKRARTITG
jgi:hypothetical protein